MSVPIYSQHCTTCNPTTSQLTSYLNKVFVLCQILWRGIDSCSSGQQFFPSNSSGDWGNLPFMTYTWTGTKQAISTASNTTAAYTGYNILHYWLKTSDGRMDITATTANREHWLLAYSTARHVPPCTTSWNICHPVLLLQGQASTSLLILNYLQCQWAKGGLVWAAFAYMCPLPWQLRGPQVVAHGTYCENRTTTFQLPLLQWQFRSTLELGNGVFDSNILQWVILPLCRRQLWPDVFENDCGLKEMYKFYSIAQTVAEFLGMYRCRQMMPNIHTYQKVACSCHHTV